RPRWRVPMLEHQQLRWIRTTLLGRTPGWSPPCPVVGPWRPVWIEQRAHAIGDVKIDARLDDTTGVVDVAAAVAADAARLVVERGDQRITGSMAQLDGTWLGVAHVHDAAKWWPHTHGTPARYRVMIEATRGGNVFTIDLGHTGFRTIA